MIDFTLSQDQQMIRDMARDFAEKELKPVAQELDEEPTIATAQASRGDLIISASGSGTLIPASETALGFRSGGVLTELLIEVGDQVEAGELLARLDDTDAQDQVAQVEIELRQAELDRAELDEEADPADLAEAQANLASAQAELTELMSPPEAQDLLAAQYCFISLYLFGNSSVLFGEFFHLQPRQSLKLHRQNRICLRTGEELV